jgi:hypothetical protein
MRSQILLPVVIAGFVGAAAVVACSTSSTPATVTFTVSPGVPTYTYTGSLGSCSTEDTYVVIAVGDCGGCSGSTAYALCDGTSYTDCSCDAPSGSGWVEGSSASDSGSDTGNGGDTGTDSSSVGDSSTDASSGDSSSDAGSSDAGSSDAGSADSGTADAGTG